MSGVISKFEEGAKALGGFAVAVAGAYGIFDGVKSIRSCDTFGGGFSIASRATGTLAGCGLRPRALRTCSAAWACGPRLPQFPACWAFARGLSALRPR